MAKFDANLWKNVHPASLEISGVPMAIKDWHAHCPEKYDTPDADPKKLVGEVATAVKKFLAALADAEGKLQKDKSADPKTKDKIAKTKALLNKWELEVTNYHKAVAKWSQETIKEESEELKNMQRAQLVFAAGLVDGLETAMSKMPGLAKEFDLALKAGDLKAAATRLNAHRDLLTRALFLVRPVAIAKERSQAAAKYKVEGADLNIPPKFAELAKKLDGMNTLDDDMQDRLERAAEGGADSAGEPDAASSPEYRKAVRDLTATFKGTADKMRVKIPVAAQLAQAAKQIQSVRATDPSYEKSVLNCRALNLKILTLLKEANSLRGQVLGINAALNKKAAAAKISDADNDKFLGPLRDLLLTYMGRVYVLCDKAMTMLEDWLRTVVETHPESREAKAELANMRAKKYDARGA